MHALPAAAVRFVSSSSSDFTRTSTTKHAVSFDGYGRSDSLEGHQSDVLERKVLVSKKSNMGITRKQRRWDLSPTVKRFVSSFTYSCLSVAI